MNDLFNLDEIENFGFEVEGLEKTDDKITDIAIIGMSGRFGQASDLSEYWEALKDGKDTIRNFPENRAKDCQPYIGYMKSLGFPDSAMDFIQASYLDEIDQFDYNMFSISHKEANLMDPNMRIFLEECISSIHDAGYAGKRIKGSNTGVFVGFSSDFGEEYKRLIQILDTELIGLSVTGNIKSVISGRVAYLLDLHGPAMCVDTACSSSLTALYCACQALGNKDCDMALVGSVKLSIIPVTGTQDSVIGIQSSDNRARTFDNSASGTGLGEGAGVVLLKPLRNAEADGDNIYAVIKGIAVNQDGETMGLTAPNSKAQADVICRAWENAGVRPDDISYIEAHGTATPLGDTVEISAIENAFKRFTNRKQFCGIGSVKTNIGHTDHLAGMASLIKVVLALKNKMIPPSLHFERPNSNISFDDSPVYIVDKLTRLEERDSKVKCGISAFGLSGTNTHVVIEEYRKINTDIIKKEQQLLLISANSKDSLVKTVHNLLVHVKREKQLRIEDICWTMATGRNHDQHRIAFLVNDREDLIGKLEMIDTQKLEKAVEQEEIYWTSPNRKWNKEKIVQRSRLTEREEKLHIMAIKYACGEEIQWESIFKRVDVCKVSLPGIVFDRKKCWLHAGQRRKNINNPLLVGECAVRTIDCDIYRTVFNVEDYWVLNEHIVNGIYVLPGTTYLEMIITCMKDYSKDEVIEFLNILFISPFGLEKGKSRELYINIYKKQPDFRVVISSYDELTDNWSRHCEGTVVIKSQEGKKVINVDSIKESFHDVRDIIYDYDNKNQPIITGNRWNNIKRVYVSDDQVLAEMSMEAYKDEVGQYYLHPAFLDNGVNIAIQELNDNMYLPLSYKVMKVYDRLPVEIYSYIHKKESVSDEVILFDVSIADKNGRVLVDIQDYAIKKVRDDYMIRTASGNNHMYETVTWVEKEKEDRKDINQGKTIILSTKDSDFLKFNSFKGWVSINIKNFISDDRVELFRSLLEKEQPDRIILYVNTDNYHRIDTMKSFEYNLDLALYTLFDFAKAITKIKKKVELIVITKYANKVLEADREKIQPIHTAVGGLVKVMEKENVNLTCRVIDVDDETTDKVFKHEISCMKGEFNVTYRLGRRYVQLFKNVVLDRSNIKADYIKQEAVYLITGGSGSLGIAVAKMLAEEKNVRILLVGRKKIDIEVAEKDSHVDDILSGMQNIRKLGSTIEYHSLDISDENQVRHLLEKLDVKINGVFHAAGVAGDGFLALKDKESFTNVIAPKIRGTWIIDRLIGKQNPDFIVMFSSISSVIGEAGQGDYVAANDFLNGFAVRDNQFKLSISILWPAWKEIGMAVKHGIVNDKNSLFQSLDTQTALESLNIIANNNMTNVIPANLNKKVLLDVVQDMDIEIDSEILKQCKKTAEHDNHNIVNQNVKSGDIRENLMRIWSEVLEIDDLNPDHNFYNLGGDSIIATYLLRKLEEEYPGILDITDIFSYPTVNEMYRYIEGKRKGDEAHKKAEYELKKEESQEDEMDAILNRLANNEVSIDDVRKYI